MSVQVIPTGATLGARIEGVDLTKPLDDATFNEVRRAFYEHEVVYFRGTELSEQDHIRFSARFGELRRLKLDQLHAQHPEIFVMWDDCSTQHKATFDYALPLRRLMHRTTVINGL